MKGTQIITEKLYRTHFPYGLRQKQNGMWFMFNREYHLLGRSDTRNAVSIYDDANIPDEYCFKIQNKLPLEKLDRIEDSYFLYKDATNPMQGEEHMKSYLEKLAILAKLNIY